MTQHSAESRQGEIVANTTPLPEPDERRAQALEDGSGFSHHLAEISLSGYDPDRQPESRLRDFSVRASGRSRRGGRSYPEPSDSELDPNWKQSSADLTPEEEASRATATAHIRDTQRHKEVAKLIANGAEPAEIDLLAAVHRARDERRRKRL